MWERVQLLLKLVWLKKWRPLQEDILKDNFYKKKYNLVYLIKLDVKMNFFYDLPDEIQEKIYFEAHKLNSKDLFKQIKKIDLID